ncbi:MAG: hypothetical protein ACO4CG_06420, partial [Prochlorothrix sp.]
MAFSQTALKTLHTLLNQSLQAQGVQVQITQRDRQLHFLLEGQTVSPRDRYVALIQQGFQKLQRSEAWQPGQVLSEFQQLEGVTLYGRVQGQTQVDWTASFPLGTHLESSPSLSQNQIPKPQSTQLQSEQSRSEQSQSTQSQSEQSQSAKSQSAKSLQQAPQAEPDPEPEMLNPEAILAPGLFPASSPTISSPEPSNPSPRSPIVPPYRSPVPLSHPAPSDPPTTLSSPTHSTAQATDHGTTGNNALENRTTSSDPWDLVEEDTALQELFRLDLPKLTRDLEASDPNPVDPGHEQAKANGDGPTREAGDGEILDGDAPDPSISQDDDPDRHHPSTDSGDDTWVSDTSGSGSSHPTPVSTPSSPAVVPVSSRENTTTNRSAPRFVPPWPAPDNRHPSPLSQSAPSSADSIPAPLSPLPEVENFLHFWQSEGEQDDSTSDFGLDRQGRTAQLLMVGLLALSIGLGGFLVLFLPQQSRSLAEIQAAIEELEQAPQNTLTQLQELEADLALMKAQLDRISRFAVGTYNQAQGEKQALQQFLARVEAERSQQAVADANLKEAKRFAAEAIRAEELNTPLDREALTLLQEKWIAANYFLALVPTESWAGTEADRL